jgi:hypothetical protein
VSEEPYRNRYLPGIIIHLYGWSGSNSGVECQLPKLDVAGSNPVSRSRVAPPTPNMPKL